MVLLPKVFGKITTHVDSAKRYTGSLVIILRTYRYGHTRTSWRISSVACARMLLGANYKRTSIIIGQSWGHINLKPMSRHGGLNG
jgi:hypothetical protein